MLLMCIKVLKINSEELTKTTCVIIIVQETGTSAMHHINNSDRPVLGLFAYLHHQCQVLL